MNNENEIIERQKKLKQIRILLNEQSVWKVFLKEKRFKEFFFGKEALCSLIISLILLATFITLFLLSNEKFIEYIPNILIAMLGGYITLIGLSLSAFALVVSGFNKDSFLDLIVFDEKGNLLSHSKELVNNFITIIYRFYLSATYNVIALLMLCLTYIYIVIPFFTICILSFLLGFIVLYYITFCLIFTLTLFSSCIQLVFFY
ncbi:hypothetical protein [Staphylococcus epidermidis]|uniref:hypothetical protein n=1 Tax=Staphylococcus epidermidis TaxID=1282 RepID=UPI00193354F8|nr:hypothetical protein [Staphylococcus epidermidis]MBM6268630.1 hypothetical protein [Staphylococcus epidermidis]MCO6219844.1 hypothetical protein [Staphylococcus epidermidis]MCO6291951.1 hypothetical protein [Staphylococcus epidermidis]MCO6300334.1 hypothetical protein [Staphylococcus epidermidis]